MKTFFRNWISKLCNAVSASAAATWDTFLKRRQRVREIDSLLYNKMSDNIEYGRERLKDNVQKRDKGRRDRRRREKIWERHTGENVNSTASKNERTIKDAYRRFVKSGKVNCISKF